MTSCVWGIDSEGQRRRPSLFCKTKMKLMKKIRRHIASRSGDAVLATNNLPPITFHSTHGENVRVLCAGAVARRAESFCKGIAFSNRPLRLNEKIFMKFVETSASWSGVVRFGFTSVDPGTVRGALPKYACPDLTNKPGYWAKALAERYAEQDVVLFFYVTASGDVHFGINGEEKGVFFSGVDTRGPLWALLDIYGNTIAMEILDSRANLNNMLRRAVSLPSDVDNAAAALEALSFSSPVSSSSSDPPVHFHAGIPTELISFHSVHGQNIRLSNDSTVATRNDTEFSCGYVFLKRSVSTDEKIIIQVLQTENIYIGALAFGLTNCDPAMLTFTPLPEDSDCLLDRPEYWVVLKDVANAPQRGDELAFTITTDGKVLLFKNRSPPVVIMYVDQTQRLWPFFDVYGNTTKIKILGCAKNTAVSTNGTDVSNMSQLCVILPPLSTGSSAHRAKAISAANVHRKSLPIDQTFCPSPKSSLPDAGQGLDGCQDNANNECAVCYEKAIDCVLYTCGHMCMCFECAHQLWKRPAGGQCPICRADIRDVIRTYRS